MLPEQILIGMALFQVKHFFADYLLQSGYMVRNKGRYGHPGGLAHAGMHALCSLPVLALIGLSLPAILLTALVEGVAHYHIDWGKEQAQALLGVEETQLRYWHIFGTDQLLHQLTYVAMLAYWAL